MNVRRARNSYCYDRSGRRVVDMGQIAPWAVLGLRPWGMARALRVELDRGGMYLCDSMVPSQLERALARLTGRTGSWAAQLPDRVSGQGTVPTWRPFLPVPGVSGPLVVLLPLPPSFQLALVHSSAAAGQADVQQRVPRVALRVTEHIAGVLAGIPERRKQTGRPLPGLPSTALSEAWWSHFDAGPFSRSGPYLFYRGPQDSYHDFRQHMGDAGFLLPTDPATPATIPLELSAGELARYLERVQSVPHGG